LKKEASLYSSKSTFNILALMWLFLIGAFSYAVYPVFAQRGGDFFLYHSIGELYQSTAWQYMYVSKEQGPYYAYSPLAAPLFWPLGMLPISIAQVTFFIMKIVTYACWPFIIAEILEPTIESPTSRIALGIVSSASIMPAIYEETWAGNINLFCITGLLAAAAQLTKKKTFSAAAIATVIATIKPQYALFLAPAMLQNFKQSFTGASLAMASLLGLSLSIYGLSDLIHLCLTWLHLISIPIAGADDINNVSYSAWLERLFALKAFQSHVQPISAGLIAVTKLGLVSMSLAAIWKLSKAYRSDKIKISTWVLATFSFLSLLTLLVTPVIWITHQMLLIFSSIFTSYLFWKGRSWILFIAFISIPVSLYISSDLLQNSVLLRDFSRTYGLTVIATCLSLLTLSFYSLYFHDFALYSRWKRTPARTHNDGSLLGK
jgi:hypothetical protein